MKHTPKLRAKLLGTSALAVLGSVWIGAGTAAAIPGGACVTVAGATTTITCDGYVNDQVSATDNTTITLNPSATVTYSGDPVISVDGEDSALVLEEYSSVLGYGASAAVEMDGEGNTVTLNDGATIRERGTSASGNYYGTYTGLDFFTGFDAGGGSVTLNGGSSINVINGYDSKYQPPFDAHDLTGVNLVGTNFDLTLNSGSSINVSGFGTRFTADYTGISVDSSSETLATRPTITLNGSSVNVNGSADGTTGGTLRGIVGAAIDDDKYAPEIVLNDEATVNVASHAAGDFDLAGIASYGIAPTITLNGASEVNLTGAGGNGNKYLGVIAVGTGTSDGSPGFDVSLNGGSSITINGGGSATNASMIGIVAKGYFYGVDGVGGGSITLNDGSSVTLNGAGDSKYLVGVESIGAGVDVTLNGGSTIEINGYGSNDTGKYFGIIVGEGSATADGVGTVTLNGGSSITINGGGATDDAKYVGLVVIGSGDTKYASNVTLNNSTITINGAGSPYSEHKYVGAIVIGNDQTTLLKGTSQINVNASFAGLGYVLGLVSYGTGNTITLNDESGININAGDAEAAVGALVGGTGSTISLNGSSHIVVNGEYAKYSAAILVRGSDNAVVLNGSSYAGVYSNYGETVAGIAMDSANSTVTLNDDSAVNVVAHYAADVYGLKVQGGGALVTLNGDATVSVYGAYADSLEGIHLSDAGNTVVLNGNSLVEVSGYGAHQATGILANADYASVTMNGNSRLNIGSSTTNYARGIRIGGYGSSVTLNDNASINVESASSDVRFGGVVLTNNENMSLTLNDYASISTTSPDGLAGIFLRGVDDSTVVLNDASTVDSDFGDGVYMRAVTGTTITLNGASQITSQHANGIYGRNLDGVTINVGEDASVTGETGINLNGVFNEVNVSGTVASYGTYAITFAGANNTLTLNSATIDGRIRGSFSNDHLVLEGAGVLNDAVRGFETLDVNASGIWDIAKYGSANTVTINSGKLAVNGILYASNGVTVANGGTLGGNGNVYGEVTVLAGGTVAPGNSPGTLNVIGPVTFNSGSVFSVEFEGAAADLLTATGNVTIDPGAIIQPTFLGGVDGFVGDVITSGGTVTGTFTPGAGASLVYTAGSVSLTATSSSSMNGGVGGSASAGFSFLDTVMGQATAGSYTGKSLWASAIFDQSDRTSVGTSKGYSQKSNGGAFGGTLMQTSDTTVGLAGGYLDSSVNTVTGSSRSSIDGFHVAAYGTYTFSGTVLTAAVTGAYQDQDVTRRVLVGGVVSEASGSPKAWLGGAGFGVAHPIPLEQGFTLTPRASLGWQHLERDGYTETGGGAAAYSLNQISTDTVRGQVGAELSLMVKDPNANWSVRPNIHGALAQEWRDGDTNATGTFTATGLGFTAPLDNRDQTYLAVGAGVDVTVGHGITAFASYDGGFGGDEEKLDGLRFGARFEW